MANILIETDTAPTLHGTLTDVTTGDPLDLSGATVFFQMRLKTDRRFRVNAACDIVSAADGTVSYDFADDDLDFEGESQAQFMVVYPGGAHQTTAVPIDITVRAR